MSNPVSLYVASPDECFAALPKLDEDSEDSVEFDDYLEEADTDGFMYELSEVYEQKHAAIANTPADRLLRMLLWTHLDAADPSDYPRPKIEAMGLDLALSPEAVKRIGADIEAFDSAAVAEALHAPNDAFESPEDLREYLGYWTAAFRAALKEGKGIFYRIWV